MGTQKSLFVVGTIVGMIVLLGAIGVGYVWLHCKLRWPDTQMMEVHAADVFCIDLQPVPRENKRNLVSSPVAINDSSKIDTVLQLMHQGVGDMHNHPITIWRARMTFRFKDDTSLFLGVLQTKNQGTQFEFCEDCFGVKSVVRNDALGKWLEDEVGYVRAVE